MTSKSEIEEAIQTVLLKRVVTLLTALFAVALGIAFGGGAWVTRVDGRLNNIEASFSRLEENIPPRWVSNEIGRLARQSEEIERRVGSLESQAAALGAK